MSCGQSLTDIPSFDRIACQPGPAMTRIGTGALGGKASGLAMVVQQILPRLEADELAGFDVDVPRLTVLTSDLFDAFMTRNDLYPAALRDSSDQYIAHEFQKAELPAEHLGDLRALIGAIDAPLAVRSSSLLEDALDHPFAGVYGTKMIPNNEVQLEERFRRFVGAAKFVYASTFFADAKGYFRSIGRDLREEKMALVVQEVIGQRSFDRHYPCVSGVARSYNFYPAGAARPDEGVVNLALGLGKTIVDGGLSWSYSPLQPKAPPPFNNIGDLLENTQRRFWAVHMGRPEVHDPVRETECLVEAGLAEAEADGALKYLASTYDPASDRLNPGVAGRGARALTFAPILGSPFIRFNDVVRRLVEVSKEVVGCDVEIEFAVNLHRRDVLPARVGFLQVRPMKVVVEAVEVHDDEMSGDNVLLASDIVLGNGARSDLNDIVYLRPEAFDPALTPEMVWELEEVNAGLLAAGRDYLLIGFGRWGTSDPWLGVPVAWSQISGARVIVEATLPRVNPDLSQGSHFFHNLLSFRILYISVLHDGVFPIDWAWLDAQPAVRETRFVRHVRTAAPLAVRVDGSNRRGVVTHDV